jgi:hypothetical protein
MREVWTYCRYCNHYGGHVSRDHPGGYVRPGALEMSADWIEEMSFNEGSVIERDPDTNRMYIRIGGYLFTAAVEVAA